MDKKLMSKLLMMLEYLPNSPIKDADEEKLEKLVDIYYSVLQDLPPEMVKAAVSGYLATEKFFPAPGDLRNKVVDIALLTMDVPTEAEAWGQINQERYTQSKRCVEGIKLHQAAENETGNHYWAAVAAYGKHVDECDQCSDEVMNEWHPAVQSAFEKMGGRFAIFTDNPAADRARFSDGYRAFVQREVLKLSLPSDVQNFIAASKEKLNIAGQQIKTLTARMTHPDTKEVLENVID